MNQITNPIKNIVCSNWKGRITGKETILQALKIFVSEPQAQEYCLTKNYPTADQLETIKDEALLFNVFINQAKTVTNLKQIFVFGDSVMTVIATNYQVCSIVATNNSFINIEAKGNSIVNIEMYQNANCIIKKSNTSKINIINK